MAARPSLAAGGAPGPAAGRGTVHGVLLEVAGRGLLLTGPSGAGKSQAALELLHRGHRLVADDAPELFRRGDRLWGRCPPPLRGFLEVRGLGVLNVEALLGPEALREEVALALVVELVAEPGPEPGGPAQEREPPAEDAPDRLRPARGTVALLGLPLPRLRLPAGPGRPLGLLVETLARQEALRAQGYDAAADLAARQAGLLGAARGAGP